MRSRFIARLWILSALVSFGLIGIASTARAAAQPPP